MNSNDPPLITVLMPVYNGESYLCEAIDSILAQTLSNFEFIVVNDGSTDGTVGILDRYADSRLVRVTNERNLGLIPSLNRGLQLIRGKYVARMDADDVSLPERLEKQVEFLERHPEIGIVGSSLRMIDHLGQPWPSYNSFSKVPTQPNVVAWHLLFQQCVAHPTMMVRRTVYEQLVGYCETFIHAEDYEFLLRASLMTQIANLPNAYLHYRIHLQSVSRRFTKIQLENSDRAKQKIIEEVLNQKIRPILVQSLFQYRECTTPQQFQAAASLLVALYEAYVTSRLLSETEKDIIQRDMLRRLAKIALTCYKIAPLESYKIWQESTMTQGARRKDAFIILLMEILRWKLNK